MDPENAEHHDRWHSLAHRGHTAHAAVDAVGATLHDGAHAARHAFQAAHPPPVTIPSQATLGMRGGPAIQVPGTPTAPEGLLARSAGTLARLQQGVSIAGGAMGLVTTPLAVREAILGNREGNTDRTVQGLAGAVGGAASVVEGGATVASLLGAAGGAGVAAAAAPLAAGAAGFSGGYALGRHLDTSIGELAGELGATREVTGRDGQTRQVRDDRAVSDRLGDAAASNRTASRAALSMAPYLPRFLGGDW